MGLSFGNYEGGLIREAPPANPVFFMPVCIVEAGATSKVHADLHLRCRRAPAGIDDPLAVLGGWRRWRVEHPENSVCNRRPSRCFRLKSFNSHGDRRRLVAKRRTVITFGLLWVLDFEKMSTVTEIGGSWSRNAQLSSLVDFLSALGTFLGSLRPKSVNSHRDCGPCARLRCVFLRVRLRCESVCALDCLDIIHHHSKKNNKSNSNGTGSSPCRNIKPSTGGLARARELLLLLAALALHFY